MRGSWAPPRRSWTNMPDLDEILLEVEKPGRYLGCEYNLPDMTKPCGVRFCICFPDLYEVGMSNLGIQIIYDILNRAENAVCERCFAPWPDFAQKLRENAIPLFSLETRRPLAEFDVLGFSVTYEMSYTSILYMLDLAGIPFRAKDRDDSFPIVAGGGPASVNPEPIIDFFDLFFIGEGEEIDLAVARVVERFKGDKRKILEECAKIDGVYVPSLAGFENGVCVGRVRKATVADLDKAPYPTRPLVPNVSVVHDRGVAELFRGCYAGCRFCQACFFYRPVRYRERATVVRIAKELIDNCGYDEIGLTSLSSGDYGEIYGVLEDIAELSKSKNVLFQLPSLRLDSYTAKLTRNARKSSLTFAPEAGTQRLRDVINKNISDEDIEKTMRLAFESGYRAIKLYFMIGLPTETDADLWGIAETVEKIRATYRETVGDRRLSVSISVATFVPKPLTPFQWSAQIGVSEMERRSNILRDAFSRMKGVKYSWHEPYVSMLEGVFARGDRRLSRAVERAYANGRFLDGWTELFDRSAWEKALIEADVDISEYVGARATDSVLPWDFIDFGVTKEYLLKEYEKALAGIATPPCKHACNGCGANRFAPCRRHDSPESR